jgi:hypothetical protein
LFSSVVFALEKHGFKIESYQMPIINIQYKYSENGRIQSAGFQKKCDHSFNPSGKFAILTCSSADRTRFTGARKLYHFETKPTIHHYKQKIQ